MNNINAVLKSVAVHAVNAAESSPDTSRNEVREKIFAAAELGTTSAASRGAIPSDVADNYIKASRVLREVVDVHDLPGGAAFQALIELQDVYRGLVAVIETRRREVAGRDPAEDPTAFADL